MVEIEKVIDAMKDKPVTVKEIATKIGCSEDAVHNVILLITARKTPVIYVSVAKGGMTYAYTINKPTPAGSP